MSKWAKELAPNLFNSFEDWYDNYILRVGMEPEDYQKEIAIDYFQEIRMLHKEDYSYDG